MTTATITSQGQITIPAEVRRALGLRPGDKLNVDYHTGMKQVQLSKPMSLEEITDFAMRHIDPNAKPVHNVDKYYQKYRGETIR